MTYRCLVGLSIRILVYERLVEIQPT